MTPILSSAPFLTPSLLRQAAQLRGELQRTSSELTTGITSDPGKRLRGDFSGLAAIDHSLTRIEGFTATIASLSQRSDAMQAGLAMIAAGADTVSTRLLTTSGVASASALDSSIADVGRYFAAAISALNVTAGGHSVFAGVNSDSPPLPDAETVLAALETAVAGATTASAMSAAIDDWFMGAAGFELLYTGGAGRTGLPIGEAETAALPQTALDPAIRATLAGLAQVALLDRGAFAGDHDSRAALARSSADILVRGAERRQGLAARIGSVQQLLSEAQSRNGAQKTALGIARLSMIEADPFETATRLQEIEARLDTFYTLTARLSHLRLTDYLR